MHSLKIGHVVNTSLCINLELSGWALAMTFNVFSPQEITKGFMKEKGTPIKELYDPHWASDLAFLAGVSTNLNIWNLKQQNKV